ncbi:MAG: hypothetical protein AAF958_02220 [Planctomycetota bacterium]
MQTIRQVSEDPTLSILSESVLIRDDFYCGRILRAPGYRGVWFIEQNELKVSREGGAWLRTIDCSAAEIQATQIQATSIQPATAESQTPEIEAEVEVHVEATEPAILKLPRDHAAAGNAVEDAEKSAPERVPEPPTRISEPPTRISEPPARRRAA